MTPNLVGGDTIYLFLGVSSAGRRSDPYLGEREILALSVGRPSVGVGGVTPTSVSWETLTYGAEGRP